MREESKLGEDNIKEIFKQEIIKHQHNYDLAKSKNDMRAFRYFQGRKDSLEWALTKLEEN